MIAAKVNLPKGLPHRHIYWREEMADGVIGKEKNGTPAGLDKPLDWYRFKADQMAFLGINTFAKDLLEFGAVQHWDSSVHGGDKWAYYNREHAPLWSQIVKLMGEHARGTIISVAGPGGRGRPPGRTRLPDLAAVLRETLLPRHAHTSRALSTPWIDCSAVTTSTGIGASVSISV